MVNLDGATYSRAASELRQNQGDCRIAGDGRTIFVKSPKFAVLKNPPSPREADLGARGLQTLIRRQYGGIVADRVFSSLSNLFDRGCLEVKHLDAIDQAIERFSREERTLETLARRFGGVDDAFFDTREMCVKARERSGVAAEDVPEECQREVMSAVLKSGPDGSAANYERAADIGFLTGMAIAQSGKTVSPEGLAFVREDLAAIFGPRRDTPSQNEFNREASAALKAVWEFGDAAKRAGLDSKAWPKERVHAVLGDMASAIRHLGDTPKAEDVAHVADVVMLGERLIDRAKAKGGYTAGEESSLRLMMLECASKRWRLPVIERMMRPYADSATLPKSVAVLVALVTMDAEDLTQAIKAYPAATSWPKERIKYVSERLQEAFTQIGKDAGPADVARGVEIVFHTESCFDRALEASVRRDIGYSRREKDAFHEAMRTNLLRNGPLSAATVGMVKAALEPFVARASAVDQNSLYKAVAREMETHAPLDKQCAEIRAYVRSELAKGVDSFFRDNTAGSAATARNYIGLASRDFADRLYGRLERKLRELSAFEFFEKNCNGLERPADVARQTRDAFMEMMPSLLGRLDDDQSIANVVNDLSATFCRLVAEAHKEAEAGMRALDLGAEERLSIHRSIDGGFLMLRGVNARLIDKALANGDKNLQRKMTSLTVALQSVANGVAFKSALHPAIADFGQDVANWSNHFAKFMRLANERGERLMKQESEADGNPVPAAAPETIVAPNVSETTGKNPAGSADISSAAVNTTPVASSSEARNASSLQVPLTPATLSSPAPVNAAGPGSLSVAERRARLLGASSPRGWDSLSPRRATGIDSDAVKKARDYFANPGVFTQARPALSTAGRSRSTAVWGAPLHPGPPPHNVPPNGTVEP